MPINLIADGTTNITISGSDEIWRLAAGDTMNNTVVADAITFNNAATNDNTTILIDGTINSDDYGIETLTSDDNQFIQISSSGDINAGRAGVLFYSTNSFLINEGEIGGRTTGGVFMADNNTTLVNSGTIESRADDGVFIFESGPLVGFAHVTNSGSIIGQEYGLYSDAQTTLIENSGIISGDLESVNFSTSSGETATLINSGRITSADNGRAILGFSGSEFIINTGVIGGNVALGNGNDYLDTSEGRVLGTVFGQGGDDFLRGGERNDRLVGGDGNDRLFGAAGDDRLTGTAGNDIIRGGGGNDTLKGGFNNDNLRGGAGNDLLIGGSGVDILNGGRGNDRMNAGSGADTFVFGLQAGNDRISNWEDGIDEIDLTLYGITSSATLGSAISNSSGDAIVDLSALGGSGEITIAGAAGQIDVSDFLI